ncbi:MAG: hypothetical protein VKN33_00970 [Candidatus Sericytochromatia bacterium]|nr:hypothetical protein [Candidatus Sericytochromatia bacterium]
MSVYFFGVLLASVASCSAPVTSPNVMPTTSSPSPSPAATPSAAMKPHQEACLHMSSGPQKDVEAALLSSGAPVIAADHHRYDVTLKAQGDRFGGTVVFNNPTAGDVRFYLGFAGPISPDTKLTLTQAGKPLAFESVDTEHVHEECSDIKVLYVAEVGVGPVEINMAGFQENVARLVLEGGSGEDGHADDHEEDHGHDHE